MAGDVDVHRRGRCAVVDDDAAVEVTFFSLAAAAATAGFVHSPGPLVDGDPRATGALSHGRRERANERASGGAAAWLEEEGTYVRPRALSRVRRVRRSMAPSPTRVGGRIRRCRQYATDRRRTA